MYIHLVVCVHVYFNAHVVHDVNPLCVCVCVGVGGCERESARE